jgi:hypothetical protein
MVIVFANCAVVNIVDRQSARSWLSRLMLDTATPATKASDVEISTVKTRVFRSLAKTVSLLPGATLWDKQWTYLLLFLICSFLLVVLLLD